jgi:hypothetical protein
VSTDSHRVKLRIHTNHVSVDVDDYRTDGGVTVKKRTTLDENREWLAGWLAGALPVSVPSATGYDHAPPRPCSSSA